jgi:HlyD family secretion protein
LQIISIDENARTEAQRELSAVATKLSELNDRRIALEDRLSRTDIRAPMAGIVNELSVHTVGGVITPAETLATIVPENATLKIEAKLSPVDVDQVLVGQSAKLRFSAFNQRTTPEIKGEIAYVSAASTRDPATNTTHYLADVRIDASEFGKLGGQALKPGMPVEVFVATQERTAISYLSKPFMDQFAKAFREE